MKVFQVFGYSPGDEDDSQIAYRVQVDDDGTVTGSDRVRLLLELAEGSDVQVRTGLHKVRAGDPASILAGLVALTDVRQVSGDAPRLGGPGVIGAVE
ncbi:hypothetical protein GCM10022221_67460 [Actinocorallia aurea]